MPTTRLNPFRGPVSFLCNICAQPGVFDKKHYDNPELPSCAGCGSNVRFRWLVHRLSIKLFGQSIALTDFPVDRSIAGVGLTDPPRIAAVLAERFHYCNTFLTSPPKLDIRRDPSPVGKLDFLIASEVFEHVEPPVAHAFENAARLLGPEGVLLLTVPWVWGGDRHSAIPELYDWMLTSEKDGSGYSIVNRRADGSVERFRSMAFDGTPGPSFGWTREHFPELHDWRVEQVEQDGGGRGSYRLRNTLPDGSVAVFHNLVFHDGPGLALEMRLFTKESLEESLRAAGFQEIEFAMEDVPDRGIIFGHPWSRPLVARVLPRLP